MMTMLLDLINRLNYEMAINGNIPVDWQVKYVMIDDEDRPEDGIYGGELVDIRRIGSSLKIITSIED